MPEDDEDGIVELMAEAEDALPLFTKVIEQLAAELTKISEITNRAASDIQASQTKSRPAAAKLIRVEQFAKDIATNADVMEDLAAEYLEQLSRVDGGLTAMANQLATSTDREELDAAKSFYESLSELDVQAGAGLESLKGFSESVVQATRASRTIRSALNRIRSATDRVVDSRPVFSKWRSDLSDSLARARQKTDSCDEGDTTPR
jgi:hypothetical protein